jgi:hypothetical protein
MPEIIEDNELESISFSKDAPAAPKPSRHYIDDDHLTKILSEWKEVFDRLVAEGQERPKLPESVGEAICDMAEAMGKRHNFHGYSYLDEMKSDAILHCVKYIHNFNPKKLSQKKGKVSAFGYINMIIWRSFTHRIDEEKREQYLKYKSFQLMGGMDAFQDEDMADVMGDGETADIGALGQDFMSKAAEYEEKYGLDKQNKREKKVEFDGFMFELTAPTDETPEDVDLQLGEELNIDFE